MESLLIKNGRVIDPSQNLDKVADILIKNGKVSQIGSKLKSPAGLVIEAKGLIVTPGLIDIHVHLREPGREDEETIQSGSEAAAVGGFTAICCMPNTSPVNDNPSVTSFILKESERRAITHVFPIGAITIGSAGEQLAEIGEMVNAGVVGISDDGKGAMNGQLMRRAMEYSLPFKIPLIEHCEDLNLSALGVMNEGSNSTLLGLKGMSRLAEDVMAARDIMLAELTGAHIHIAHLSTRGAMELVRNAKEKGIHATCEVCPHHFALSDAACSDYDTNTKMSPPLRTDDDIKAILEGIADGTVDCLVTDHAPHNPNEKMLEFDRAPSGIIGLETAVGLVLTHLYHSGLVSLNRLVEMMSTNPAQLINQPIGTLKVDSAGDITIIDTEVEWAYDLAKTRSKSRNSPFDGTKLKGRAVGTILGGKIVYKNGDYF